MFFSFRRKQNKGGTCQSAEKQDGISAYLRTAFRYGISGVLFSPPR